MAENILNIRVVYFFDYICMAENKLKNKVSALEDYAIEIIQEAEKDFNNAMGQESLTRFDQPKKSKRNNKKPKKVGENVIIANAKKPADNKIVPNAKKPAHKKTGNPNEKKPAAAPANTAQANTPRKPIIIKKNEAKK